MKISTGAGSSLGDTGGVPNGRLFVPPAYHQTASDQAVQLDTADDWIAMRFTPEVDFKISSVCVYITAEATQGDGTLEVYSHDATNDQPNASLQVLGTLNSGGTADSWVRLAVSSGNQYQCQRNKTYWLVYKGSASVDFSVSTRRWHTGVGSMFPDGTKTMTTNDGGVSWSQAQQETKDASWNVIINGQADHVPQLHLGRFSGQHIFIPGSGLVEIPEKGVLLDCSTLTADTEYNIYIYDDGGTLTLEASTTGRVMSDGVEVKSGSTTRRFLGMIRPKEIQTGKQGPVDVLDRRLVRQPGVTKTVGKRNPYYTHATYQCSATNTWERIQTDQMRFEFLSLSNETVAAYMTATEYSTTRTTFSFGVDSDSVPAPEFCSQTEGYYFDAVPCPVSLSMPLLEGFHYVVPMANSSSNSADCIRMRGIDDAGYYVRLAVHGRISLC